jgi:hypothetical protein
MRYNDDVKIVELSSEVEAHILSQLTVMHMHIYAYMSNHKVLQK